MKKQMQLGVLTKNYLRINEIKAEFKNKLQEQCIYNAKKQSVQNENEELHKENENSKKKISELYEKNSTLESDKSSLHIENQHYIRKTTN
jgi:predicted nuclease with TOPRIM domain